MTLPAKNNLTECEHGCRTAGGSFDCPACEVVHDARIEAVARAMWEHIADVQEDPERGACWRVPVESPSWKAPAQRWEQSDGAWRQQMLDIAAVAVVTGWMIDA